MGGGKLAKATIGNCPKSYNKQGNIFSKPTELQVRTVGVSVIPVTPVQLEQ